MKKDNYFLLDNLKSYETNSIEIKNKELDYMSLAIALVKQFTSAKNEYMIYENHNTKELAIGIGKYLRFEVYPKNILTIKDGQRDNFLINDINKGILKVFEEINMNNWRMYGTVNFDYARDTYLKDLDRDNKICDFFIPEIDIRINEEKIIINYIDKKDFLLIKNYLNNYDEHISSNKISNFNAEELKSQDEDYYKKIVLNAVSEIKEDKYEKVILSRKIKLEKRFDLIESYLSGRKSNTPARSYCISSNGLEIVGFSPETVIEVDQNKMVYTFPLAGTRALTEDKNKNLFLKKELLKDPKEIAEHAVSVKLAYEELEQVCCKDSVSVIKFMDVLERGTVQHIASRLRGKLKKEFNEWDAFKILFPAVTASGIPKKESIDAIYRLEKDNRDLYSGAVLTYDKDGSLDAALVLRTAFQTEKESWIRAGAGIVKLSLPERELEETKEKLGSIVDQLVYLDK